MADVSAQPSPAVPSVRVPSVPVPGAAARLLSAGFDRAAHFYSADADGAARADDWLTEAARRVRVDERTAFRLRLCVAELAANLMQHGAPAGGAHFALRVVRRGDAVRVEYVDDGLAFDPTAAPVLPAPVLSAPVLTAPVLHAAVEPEERRQSDPAGGLGLHLLRSYAPRMTYRREAAANCLTLHFICSTFPAGPSTNPAE